MRDLTQEELDDALLETQTMLKCHGHHPHYLNTTAKVYELKAYLHDNDLTIYQESMQHAFDLFPKIFRTSSSMAPYLGLYGKH